MCYLIVRNDVSNHRYKIILKVDYVLQKLLLLLFD